MYSANRVSGFNYYIITITHYSSIYISVARIRGESLRTIKKWWGLSKPLIWCLYLTKKTQELQECPIQSSRRWLFLLFRFRFSAHRGWSADNYPVFDCLIAVIDGKKYAYEFVNLCRICVVWYSCQVWRLNSFIRDKKIIRLNFILTLSESSFLLPLVPICHRSAKFIKKLNQIAKQCSCRFCTHWIFRSPS